MTWCGFTCGLAFRHIWTLRPFVERLKRPAGHYKLDVTMAVARFQPEAVRAVIGERGQHLRGKFVTRDVLGGRTFEWSTVGTLGEIEGKLP